VLPVSVTTSGVFDGEVGSAAPTIFAAAAGEDVDELGEVDEPQAAARTESGIKAAAAYAKRVFFATWEYSFISAR
jgi:hypothetical protein